MRRRTMPGRWAAAVVTFGGGTAGAVVLVRLAWTHLRAWAAAAPAERTPAPLVITMCALAAGLALGWLCFGALLTALARLPGRSGQQAGVWARRLAPSLVRAAVATALGGSLTLGATSSAVAHTDRPATASAAATRHMLDDPLPAPGWQTAAGAGAVTDLPPPEWTPGPPPAPPGLRPGHIGLVSPTPTRGHSVEDHVVVRPGDSLWTIAARYLGPHASAEAVARDWPRWYDANRAVIGGDPDLVRPGQLLVPPPAP